MGCLLFRWCFSFGPYHAGITLLIKVGAYKRKREWHELLNPKLISYLSKDIADNHFLLVPSLDGEFDVRNQFDQPQVPR